VSLPLAIALDRAPDRATVQSVRCGGIALAGRYGTSGLSGLPTLATGSIRASGSTPLTFTATANGTTVSLIPFYKIRENYTVYWRTSS
jgi:hypothetical protein